MTLDKWSAATGCERPLVIGGHLFSSFKLAFSLSLTLHEQNLIHFFFFFVHFLLLLLSLLLLLLLTTSYINFMACLKKTGNFQTLEFDWLKSILT